MDLGYARFLLLALRSCFLSIVHTSFEIIGCFFRPSTLLSHYQITKKFIYHQGVLQLYWLSSFDFCQLSCTIIHELPKQALGPKYIDPVWKNNKHIKKKIIHRNIHSAQVLEFFLKSPPPHLQLLPRKIRNACALAIIKALDIGRYSS